MAVKGLYVGKLRPNYYTVERPKWLQRKDKIAVLEKVGISVQKQGLCHILDNPKTEVLYNRKTELLGKKHAEFLCSIKVELS